MELPFIFLSIWVLFTVVVSIATSVSSKKNTRNVRSVSPSRNQKVRKGKHVTISSDGHVVPRNQDLTCENLEGHDHRPLGYDQLPRYIVHEDPEQGYIILNGVKRKISDCKYL